MKTIKLVSIILLNYMSCLLSTAQQNNTVPDLSKITDTSKWASVNRKISYNSGVFLNGKPGDGLLYLKKFSFSTGKIELDIKGKDAQGMSFVGIAFHGMNDSTFDAVYFRPFNFKNPQRNSHSVQYISMPSNDWYKLRNEHPGVYENAVTPVPEPDSWFHATIVIETGIIKVYVNNAETPSLTVEPIGDNKKGWVGFWVGNNSEGWFKNLKITE